MQATVVVSCYKQERYIEACLDSIIAQEVDFDFDIVVSDDCSPDATANIISGYLQRYPNKIKAILRKQNVGAAKNYLDAHNQAGGDIVFHFDGDDIMLPGKLQKQFDFFRQDSSVNVVFHRACYFSDDGSYSTETGTPFLQKGPLMYFSATDLALWGSIAVHSTYAYRRLSRTVRHIDREFMEWFFAMDSLLPEGRAVYIDEVLVKYRCNLKGDTYLSSRGGRIKAYEIYFRDIFHYSQGSSRSLQKRLYANCLFTVLAMYRAKCGLSTQAVRFLIKNIYNFRPLLLLDVYRMRRSVAPEKRVR